MHQNIISSFKASKKERKGRFLKISENECFAWVFACSQKKLTI